MILRRFQSPLAAVRPSISDVDCALLGDDCWLLGDLYRLVRTVADCGPNLAINGIFLAGFVAFSTPWLYLLLWVVPYLTWELLIERIRNIAEHAALPDNDDRLRNTRTTRAGWLSRVFVAPCFVNYHIEHHLLVGVLFSVAGGSSMAG